MKLFGVSFGEHFHDISKVAGKISYKFTSPVVAQACILAGMLRKKHFAIYAISSWNFMLRG